MQLTIPLAAAAFVAVVSANPITQRALTTADPIICPNSHPGAYCCEQSNGDSGGNCMLSIHIFSEKVYTIYLQVLGYAISTAGHYAVCGGVAPGLPPNHPVCCAAFVGYILLFFTY